MEFGQRNRRAKRKDLIKALPSRNTVTSAVGKLAHESRSHISGLLKRAILSGGIGCTTDTWTDDYRHTTYISVVAHISLKEDKEIVYHRFVLATSEVAEMIKTGWLILPKI